jgi:nucleoside-diphosphate-sugar epimerase
MTSERQVVLITGSAGYVGTALVRALASEYEVVGLDKEAPRSPVGAGFMECDLTKDESVRDTLNAVHQQYGAHVISCVHLAAHYDFSGEPSPLYQTLTVEGTRRLLRGLQGFQVEQFVFSSTHIVMKPAESEDEVITEASPVEPGWDYPRSKLSAEEVIRNERGSIPAVILRLAGVYDADTHVVPIAQQMRRIYEKQFESYFFPGDSTHGQAFVHLDDAVDCIRRAIERRHQLGPYEVFLVAEPDVMSYAELQEQLGELIHGQEWPTIRIPKTVAKAGAWVQEKLAGEKEEPFIKPWMIDLADDHYPIAIDHARQSLGWEATRRLRSTLPEMVSRLKRDPSAWYRANKLEAPREISKPTPAR